MPNPVGAYNNVKVVSCQNQGGDISGGNGTYNAIGVFSCGVFPANDQPTIGGKYNITGYNGGNFYEFPGVSCTHAGSPTSDFQ